MVIPARPKCSAKARAFSLPCGVGLRLPSDGQAGAVQQLSTSPCVYSSSGGSAVCERLRVTRASPRATQSRPPAASSQSSSAAIDTTAGGRRLVSETWFIPVLLARCSEAIKHRLRCAERRQQPAHAGAADARRQQQAQPAVSSATASGAIRAGPETRRPSGLAETVARPDRGLPTRRMSAYETRSKTRKTKIVPMRSSGSSSWGASDRWCRRPSHRCAQRHHVAALHAVARARGSTR